MGSAEYSSQILKWLNNTTSNDFKGITPQQAYRELRERRIYLEEIHCMWVLPNVVDYELICWEAHKVFKENCIKETDIV
jgi:hypothetical protein